MLAPATKSEVIMTNPKKHFHEKIYSTLVIKCLMNCLYYFLRELSNVGQGLTVCGFPSLSSGIPDSREPTSWGEEKEGLGLNRCSKMAIIRNIDINMAVATKPKEIAFMDVPKLFHGASRSTTPVWDGVGSELVYMFHAFDLSEPKSFIVFFVLKLSLVAEGTNNLTVFKIKYMLIAYSDMDSTVISS